MQSCSQVCCQKPIALQVSQSLVCAPALTCGLHEARTRERDSAGSDDGSIAEKICGGVRASRLPVVSEQEVEGVKEEAGKVCEVGAIKKGVQQRTSGQQHVTVHGVRTFSSGKDRVEKK